MPESVVILMRVGSLPVGAVDFAGVFATAGFVRGFFATIFFEAVVLAVVDFELVAFFTWPSLVNDKKALRKMSVKIFMIR